MAKKSTGRMWLEYIPVRILFGLLGALPRRAAISAGKALARAIFAGAGRLRRTALRNLEIAFPEKSLEERYSIARRSFENLGRLLGELSQFPKHDRDSLADLIVFDFETDENMASADRRFIDEERARGRGLLLVGPHLGNWEMGVFAYSALRDVLTYLARPLDNLFIEDFTASLRTRFGNRPIDKNNSTAKAVSILRDGGILGVLPDVNVMRNDGVFVPFFGKPACTTSGVALLAMRTKAMILPMCCVWDEGLGKYRVKYGKLVEASAAGDRQQNLIDATAAYTRELEHFIREYPEQWLWIHRRWKTRPEGEGPIY